MFRTVFIFVIALAMAATAVAQAGTWQIDPNHSAAQFSVRHLGVSTVRGAFTKVTGSAKHDPADPSKDSLEATSTRIRSTRAWKCATTICAVAHFLEVKKYPTITFHSKQTKVAGPGKAVDHRRPDHSRRDQRSRARRGWALRPDQRSLGQSAYWSFGNNENQSPGFWCEQPCQASWETRLPSPSTRN